MNKTPIPMPLFIPTGESCGNDVSVNEVWIAIGIVGGLIALAIIVAWMATR